MKILIFTLFLCFSLFAARDIYAATNTLISNYPAPSGSYNKIMLQNLQTPTPVCSAANNGLLFYTNNNLQICANGQVVPVGAVACFNRFCYSTTQTPCSYSPSPTCPSPYTLVTLSGGPDNFQATTTGYWVYTAVCCTANNGAGGYNPNGNYP